MLKKNRLILLVAGALATLAIIIGCGTEEPWAPEPFRSLELVMVSAPDISTAIPHNSNVSFSWSAQGGSGKVTEYEWYLDTIETAWSHSGLPTTFTYPHLSGGDSLGVEYTFYVRVTDSNDSTVSISTSFTVAPDTVTPVPDTTTPTVNITQSPIEGSYVATGTSIGFAWEGDDGKGNLDVIEYQYAFPTIDSVSEWIEATAVTFADVGTADPAIFYVRARDLAPDSNTSAWDSVTFVIQPATILYVDDYQWLDDWGDVDHVTERDQKQFYRDVLEGYAFAEWDIAVQGMPDSSYLVDAGTPVYSTIVFCGDSEIGSTSGTMWYKVGAVGGGVLAYYLENGGNLLLTGALTVYDMTQAYPPDVNPGDFEFDWLGIDSTEWCFDYWYWFTWAMKDTATALDLPDSMKIDVAKNGDQDDYAIETPGLRQEASVTNEVIFTWGPWVDPDDPPPPLGNPVGHITYFDGTPRTATLNFDTYSMPLPEIRQTFQAILGEFGE